MTSQIKSASVLRYRLYYSKIIFTLEILLVLSVFISLLVVREEILLLPSFFLCSLIAVIFFSSYSIITQFPKNLVVEFRKAPERLIWYDSANETSFRLENMDIWVTRWFILLRLTHSSNRKYQVLLQDSFDDMEHYTGFRRYLIQHKRDINLNDYR